VPAGTGATKCGACSPGRKSRQASSVACVGNRRSVCPPVSDNSRSPNSLASAAFTMRWSTATFTQERVRSSRVPSRLPMRASCRLFAVPVPIAGRHCQRRMFPEVVRAGDDTVRSVEAPRALDMERVLAPRPVHALVNVAEVQNPHRAGPPRDCQRQAEERMNGE
jgi:hypothetical protein